MKKETVSSEIEKFDRADSTGQDRYTINDDTYSNVPINKVVNVLGHKYELMYINETDIPEKYKSKLENNMGLCENFEKKLIVLNNLKTDLMYERKDLLEQKVARHELLHAYMFNSGLSQLWDKDTEEALVDFLAINLFNIYTNVLECNFFIEEMLFKEDKK